MTDANEEICREMKSYFENDKVKLPKGINFINESDSKYRMILNAREVQDENMQVDDNAFEGWVVCAYIALKDKINTKIILDVKEVFEYEQFENNGHLNRFLYRAMRFSEHTRHTDPTIWFDYDGMPGVEFRFDDILTEKIYALHYAPFEYSHKDLVSGEYGKSVAEAYQDHGGVCSILANTYGHFIYNILGETDWQYAYYSNSEVNHEVLIIKTEDGKCFQVDNCGVDYWWLGIETIPDLQKISNYSSDYKWESALEKQKDYLNTSKEHYWFDFVIQDYDFDNREWKNRSIWYDYTINDWNAYLGNLTPKYYVCNYIGLEKIISMAGYANLDGYIDIDELKFSRP